MEDKTICLLVLGIVAVIAIVGLIMLFSEMSKSGAFTISTPTVSQCPSGTAAYPFTTAQSLMQSGAAKCSQRGVKWCCAKIAKTSIKTVKSPVTSARNINT